MKSVRPSSVPPVKLVLRNYVLQLSHATQSLVIFIVAESPFAGSATEEFKSFVAIFDFATKTCDFVIIVHAFTI